MQFWLWIDSVVFGPHSMTLGVKTVNNTLCFGVIMLIYNLLLFLLHCSKVISEVRTICPSVPSALKMVRFGKAKGV